MPQCKLQKFTSIECVVVVVVVVPRQQRCWAEGCHSAFYPSGIPDFETGAQMVAMQSLLVVHKGGNH